MNINRVPPRRGRKWVLDGGDLFIRAPLVFLLYGVLLQLLTFLMPVGIFGLVVVVILPIMLAGVMLAARRLTQNRHLELRSFFTVFGDPEARGPLLRLGLLNLGIGILAALALVTDMNMMAETGVLDSIQSGKIELLTVDDMNVITVFLFKLFLLMVVVSVLNFFAIPLAAFHYVSPLQAMLASLRASLINWLPMLVYGLAALLLFAAVGLVLLLVSGVAGMLATTIAGAERITTFFMFPLMLAVQMILLCAQYLAYNDIFGDKIPDTPETELLA